MKPLDWVILFIGVAIVIWNVAWLGTYRGQRTVNGFSDEQFKIFVILNASLIIAFALVGFYFVHRMGVFK